MSRVRGLTWLLPIVLVLAGGASADAQTVYAPNTPVRRSIERIHKNTTPQPGTYWSVGYQTYLRGVALRDLFEIDPTKPNPDLGEATARFTHVEPEATACLESVIPSNLVAPEYPVMNTIAHAKHYIYYVEHPLSGGRRDWDIQADFQRGTVAAIYDLVDETDAIDPIEGVGTGHAVAYLRSSTRITLPSGGTLDFKDYGVRLLSEFFFQAKPIPQASTTGLTSTVTPVTTTLTSGKAPEINSRFRDSGIWFTMAPIGAAAPLISAAPCPPPL